MARSGHQDRQILRILERLNDKDTQRTASDDLMRLVKDLDAGGAAALVAAICVPSSWDPKPCARREAARALAAAAAPTSRAHAALLQPPLLGKAVGYLKKHMQDADASVREASVDALAALAAGAAAAAATLGGAEERQRLPGAAAANPFLRAALECLAEQKRESQAAGAGALQRLAPHLEPLDKEHVKLILRCLKAPSFAGAPQLLAAIASMTTVVDGSGSPAREPAGLLRHGAEAFLPVFSQLIGTMPNAGGGGGGGGAQSSPAAASSGSGGGSSGNAIGSSSSTSGGGGSGILGCLSRQDWAARRAAADVLTAAALTLGPAFEPHGAWQAGDPASLSARCLVALERARFDKVKEARQCAREAAAALRELQRFVLEGGGGNGGNGDWAAAALAASLEAAAAAGTPGGAVSAQASQASMCGGGNSRTSPRRAASAQPSPRVTSAQRAKWAAAAAMPSEDAEPILILSPKQRKREEEANEAKELAAQGQEAAAGDASPDPPLAQAASPTPQATTPAAAAAGARRASADRPSTAPAARAAGSSAGGGAARRTADAPSPPPLPAHGRRRSTQSLLAASCGGAGDRSGAGAGIGGTVAVPAEEWEATLRELSRLRAQQLDVAEALRQLAASSTAAVASLQARVAALEAAQQHHQRHGHAAAAAAAAAPAHHRSKPAAGVAAHRSSGGGLGGALSRSVDDALSPLLGRGFAKAAAGSGGGSGAGGAAAAVARSTPALDLSGIISAMPPSAGDSCGTFITAQDFAPSPRPHAAATPAELEAAYAAALAGGGASDMRLLRLIMRTGPCWAALSPATAGGLLGAFARLVRDGAMLQRVLPWLWRLADDDGSGGGGDAPPLPALAAAERAQLLHALDACPCADDATRASVALLHDTLKAAWRLDGGEEGFGSGALGAVAVGQLADLTL